MLLQRKLGQSCFTNKQNHKRVVCKTDPAECTKAAGCFRSQLPNLFSLPPSDEAPPTPLAFRAATGSARMIHYTRTEGYGLAYFLRLRGSLLPRCLPAMCVAVLIAALVSTKVLDKVLFEGLPKDDDGNPIKSEFFGATYSMEMFGVVFGYLCISRLQVSYDRYWEGVSQVKTMHANWLASCSQVLSFDRIDDDTSDNSNEPFCMHVVKLYMQLSALAMLRLHVSEDVEKSNSYLDEFGADKAKAVSRQENANPTALNLGSERPSTRDKLEAVLTAGEVESLKRKPDPVNYTMHRVSRAISTRGRTRGWKTPAPLYQQVWTQLCEGTRAYHHASKIKEVPMPFAYVQFNALLLLLFNVLTPFTIACFTEAISMACVTSAIVVGGFSAIWMVSNELEDPFGADDNDLPMLAYHEKYCEELRELLYLMPEDQFMPEDMSTGYGTKSAWPGFLGKLKANSALTPTSADLAARAATQSQEQTALPRVDEAPTGAVNSLTELRAVAVAPSGAADAAAGKPEATSPSMRQKKGKTKKNVARDGAGCTPPASSTTASVGSETSVDRSTSSSLRELEA